MTGCKPHTFIMCRYFLFLAIPMICFAAQTRMIISSPTAVMLNKGQYDLDFRLLPFGGLAGSSQFGIHPRFNLGVGWGVGQLVGQGDMEAFIPGVLLKLALLEENYYSPRMSIGFDNRPISNKTDSRHYFKSKGFFLAVSKEFLFLAQPTTLAGGVNYSLVDNKFDEEDKNDWVNFYLAIEKELIGPVYISMDYDAALDDNSSHNPFEGYLNFAISYHFSDNLLLELDMRDLLENKEFANNQNADYTRELRVVYLQRF